MESNLPFHKCQSTYCTNRAGYWPGRIVLVGATNIPIMGWCNVCKKYVCDECALRSQITESEWNSLCNQQPSLKDYSRHKVRPTVLICRRCGTVLRKGKNDKILVVTA